MRSYWLALWLAILPACDETTLLLDLTLESGRPQPSSLEVSLYHDGILLHTNVPTNAKSLPGSLYVRHVPPGPALRVQVDGLDSTGAFLDEGAAVVDISEHQKNRLALSLGARLPDGDGDGVPDVVDDCPMQPDPDQKCGAGDLAVTMVSDLASRDLAAHDLSRVGPCPADAILCDDFESGDASKWSALETPNGSLLLAVDGVRPHAGNFSLHASAFKQDLSGNYFRSLEEGLGGLSPPFAVRTFIQTEQPLDSFTLVVVFTAGKETLTVGGADPGLWTMTEDFGSGGTVDHTSTTSIPIGQWVCLEVLHDGTNVHLYTDGTERLTFAPTISGAYDEMDVGLPRWPAHHDAEVFMDDFVLAHSRVGCN